MLINDEKLHAVETAEQELLPGVMIRHVRYRRADGSEFAANAVIAEASAVRLISGTAGGGYGLMDSVDFVPEQMRSAILGGAAVVAGINAGYFRRKYHFTPYGLSIQKGVEIAPPHSEPKVTVSGGIELGTLWLGTTPDGTLLFGSEEDYPPYRGKLDYAISFSHYLVQNGACCLAPGQGDVTHEPRSAFGITGSGALVLLAIDGRQAGHSTGADNCETAQVLLDLDVVTGVNLDGGGSTNLSVCDKYGQITTINRPCENRKVFDTILLALRQG